MLGFMRYLFGLIFVAKFSSGGEKLSCEVHTENNKIIDLKSSKLRNPAARVLGGFNSNSALECQKECCGNSNCTLFVYHQRKEKKHSCFLVSCSPKENCDYQQLNGSLLGYVTRAPRLAQEIGVMNDIVSRPTASSVPSTLIQSTFTPSPKVISSPRTARVASSTPSPKELSSPTTARVSSSTSKSSTPTEPHRTPVTPKVTTSVEANKNSTTHDDHRKKVPTTADQHTTVASLVIALCFGILFLFAVVVLIGRPWWDAYHRPRYSKVDYLMNGL